MGGGGKGVVRFLPVASLAAVSIENIKPHRATVGLELELNVAVENDEGQKMRT